MQIVRTRRQKRGLGHRGSQVPGWLGGARCCARTLPRGVWEQEGQGNAKWPAAGFH